MRESQDAGIANTVMAFSWSAPRGAPDGPPVIGTGGSQVWRI